VERAPIKWWLTFSTEDYVVLAFLLYLVLLFAADIVFGLASRITKGLKIRSTTEDSVFIIAFASNLLFLLVNLRYDFLEHFIGIVDYSDVRYLFVRMKILNPIFYLFVFGGPLLGIVCGALASRRRPRFWRFCKWLVYGLFFNILALSRLLTSEVARQTNSASTMRT
jgi:hypothetical protein